MKILPIFAATCLLLSGCAEPPPVALGTLERERIRLPAPVANASLRSR
jgi:hypothetical protein